MTSEQLEASRIERMRQNGHGTSTLEETRTWIEETGLCLFLPKRQFGSSITPTFVEAVCGQRNPTPEPKQIAVAEDMLVRLEKDGVVVRLNLQGLLGEQPDYVVAAWVLPYVYALRGDRDWRRSPQLTGSRQVSPLAVQTYKLLEAADSPVSTLKHTLGREVTEAAVARAITELWQQLRIIPMVNAPGEAAKWQLLRHRFQKAIAEGASTSQVTAISVLASIYLQAVIAATMEDVESFLSPLTARSKVREVIRGLVATRQVHTLTLGHAPHFYVAGTLPEFSTAPTYYASSTIGSSGYFLTREEEEASVLRIPAIPVSPTAQPAAESAPETAATPAAEATEAPKLEAPKVEAPKAPAKEEVAAAPAAPAARAHATRQPAANPAERPRFSRPASHSHDHKPASASRPARSGSSEERPRSARSAGARPSASRPAGARPAGSRPAGPRPAGGSRPAGSRSAGSRPTGSHSTGSRPTGARPASARPAGSRPASARPAGSRPASGARPAGSRPAAASHGRSASSARWSSASGSNGKGGSNGSAKRPSSHSAAPAGARSGGVRTAKPASASRSSKPAGKPASKPASKSAAGSRKPALNASKSGGAKRFSHSSSARPGAKKRG